MAPLSRWRASHAGVQLQTQSVSFMTWSSCPWDSPGKNTGVGCHAFLQGIFPVQGLNPGLPHCRQILYRLSHKDLTGRLTNVVCMGL